jgi:hypothetical protein
MTRSADRQANTAIGELGDDVTRVGQRARQPVQSGYHQRVALPACGQRFAHPGTLAVGAGQAVVDVDEVRGHAALNQPVAR